jgi:hypothetical protein
MTKVGYLAILAILVCVPAPKGEAQESQRPGFTPTVPAQYAATAFGQTGVAAGKTFGITFIIEGLTSDGEKDELLATLKQKGQDGLVKAMENMKDLGRISPAASVGTGVRMVRIRPGKSGGQHIVLVTNRPIKFGEVYNSTRTRDYPFGIVVLDVDTDGKGTGTFAPLNKVKFNKKGELEIENYGITPLRLGGVYRQK